MVAKSRTPYRTLSFELTAEPIGFWHIREACTICVALPLAIFANHQLIVITILSALYAAFVSLLLGIRRWAHSCVVRKYVKETILKILRSISIILLTSLRRMR